MAEIELSVGQARELTDRIRVGVSGLPQKYAEIERLKRFLPNEDERQDDNRQVYAILAWQSRKVKIGVAANPKDRIRSIQTMSPEPLELIAATKGGGQGLERHLHRKFDDLRSHGEWFHLTPGLMEILLTEEMWLDTK